MAVSGLAGFAALVALGCGAAEPERRPPIELPVNVFADTGRGGRLPIRPPAEGAAAPRAAVWLAQVTPSRPRAIEAPLPDATPAPLDELPAEPPPLEVDQGLKPPMLKAAATLRVPSGARNASVELDVRIAEDGSVSDALWAGGSSDSALVASAIDCALAMRFYPALRAGRPQAVWCRERFDFGAHR